MVFQQRQRALAGFDLGVNNPRSFVYMKGNKDLDGSIRLIPDLTTGEQLEIQSRANGVWNDTGIQIAASTVYLGRDLRISAGGDFIRTLNATSNHEGLVPHVEFDEVNGTSNQGVVPQLSPLVEDETIQPDQGTDTLSDSHTYVWSTPGDELVKSLQFLVGPTAPVEDVTVTLYRGSDDTGTLFFVENFPASAWPASTQVEVSLGGFAETFAGENIYVEVKSDTPFDLAGSLSGDPYLSHSYYTLSEEPLMSLESGINDILTDITSQVVVDDSGNVVTRGCPA